MGVTSIEWADYTFNPWIGCEKVSAGCKNCYASVDTYARVSASRGLPLWGPGSARHRTSKQNWRKPLTWNRKARAAREIAENQEGIREHAVQPYRRPRVFCASLSDVFEGWPDLDPWRVDLWRLIAECDELDWLLLTKRPENVRDMVPTEWQDNWPRHVWLGTTAENQEQAKARIPKLWDVEPPVRFVSFEPLLERVTTDIFAPWDWAPLDWMIIGGESGPGARTCDVAWIRDLMRQGREVEAAVFVKQLGALARVEGARPFTEPEEQRARRRKGYIPNSGGIEGTYLNLRDPKGGDMAEWPEDLRVREVPCARV